MQIIACVEKHWGVGFEGRIPWKNAADLKWFKEFTMNKRLLVGKNTVLPPLKDREVVRTTRTTIDDPQYRGDVVIGGPTLWTDVLEKGYVTDIYLTFLDESHVCDTFFPKYYLYQFLPVRRWELSDGTPVFHFRKDSVTREES